MTPPLKVKTTNICCSLCRFKVNEAMFGCEDYECTCHWKTSAPLKVKDGSQPVKIIMALIFWFYFLWWSITMLQRQDTIIQNQTTLINAVNKGVIANLK